MKQRVKIDSSILSFVIVLTGVLYLFPKLYPRSLFFDLVFDVVGMIIVMKGVFFRMAARAYKKEHSKKGEDLVTTGLYRLVRNPMYLGSFLIGIGFVLIVWPWWVLPIFAFVFYQRFNRQIIKEEKYLLKLFGKKYEAYAAKVPRLIPSYASLKNLNTKEAFNIPQMFLTKERYGLWAWPLLAVILETLQERVVFGVTDVGLTIFIFLGAMIAFGVGLAVEYQWGT